MASPGKRPKQDDAATSATTGTAAGQQHEAPTAKSPPSEGARPQPNGNGNGNRQPVRVLSYQIGQDTYIQASIWDRKVEKKDGTSFITYDVSVRKRYKDQETDEWKSLYSFHATELYAVVHAMMAAGAAILELRAADVPF